MLQRIQTKTQFERGASLIEYIIALTILAAVFVWVGIKLDESSRSRGSMSMETSATMVPCNPALPLDDVDPALSADSCK